MSAKAGKKKMTFDVPARATDANKTKLREEQRDLFVAGAETEVRKAQPLKKPKSIKDTFTFPPDDHALIAELIERLLQQGINVNKSEVVRMGLAAMRGFDNKQLQHALGMIERVRTGRPTKD